MGQKHKSFRESRMPFPLHDFRKNLRSMYTRVPQAMAQFVLTTEKLSHIMGPTPILEIARAYGLRPRLWLPLLIDEYCEKPVFLRNTGTGVDYTAINLLRDKDIVILQYLIVFGIKWQQYMVNLSTKQDLRLRLVKQYSTETCFGLRWDLTVCKSPKIAQSHFK